MGTRARRLTVLCLLVAAAGACRGKTSPSEVYPSVAGSYAGTATFTFTDGSTTCPATTTVSQREQKVTIATIALGGACGSTFQMGEYTITTTGAISGTDTGSYADAACGGTYTYAGTGAFSGRDLQITYTYTTSGSRCTLRSFTATLTRP